MVICKPLPSLESATDTEADSKSGRRSVDLHTVLTLKKKKKHMESIASIRDIIGNKKATKLKKSGDVFYLQLLNNKWCTRRDLNSRPSTPEADALSN